MRRPVVLLAAALIGLGRSVSGGAGMVFGEIGGDSARGVDHPTRAAIPANDDHAPRQPGPESVNCRASAGTEAPIGYGGGTTLGTAIRIPLTAAVEPRITAAIFGGGFVVHEELIEAARRITVLIQLMLSWDDEHVDRQSALALFVAFASKEKTLHANRGDHRNVHWFGVDDSFLQPETRSRSTSAESG